jgi:hypothetical protein
MSLRLNVGLFGGEAVVASAAACTAKGSDGACLIGPCTHSYALPDYEYDLVGAPNVATDVYATSATIHVGDSIAVYFVRRRWLAPCGEPADTLRGGSWSITGPWGQNGDFSGIASFTSTAEGRVFVHALASGHFAVSYTPASNPDISPGVRWQDVKFCPSPTLSPGPAIYDFKVVPKS